MLLKYHKDIIKQSAVEVVKRISKNKKNIHYITLERHGVDTVNNLTLYGIIM